VNYVNEFTVLVYVLDYPCLSSICAPHSRPLPPIIENMCLWEQKANAAHIFKQTSVKKKNALMSVTIFAGVLTA